MDVYEDHQLLITRAHKYTDSVSVNETPAKKSKVVHSKTFLKCRDHDDTKAWNITNTNCNNCILFPFVTEFPNGKLPLCVMF